MTERMKTYQEQERERRELIASITMTNERIREICNDRSLTWGQAAAQLTSCPKCRQPKDSPCVSVTKRNRPALMGGRASHSARTGKASAIIAQTIGWTS